MKNVDNKKKTRSDLGKEKMNENNDMEYSKWWCNLGQEWK